jgi:hypothetical protein
MTAEDSTHTEQPVKTEQDLRIEALEAKLSAMEKAHAQQVQELTEANRGLWAALHPAQEAQPAPAAAPQPAAGDTAYQALAGKLGLDAKE